jgi:hypothetical protein
MTVLAAEHDDGPPAAVAETVVDALRFGFDGVLELGVLLNVAAGGRADLHEGELALVARVALEEGLDGLEALDDALGVVEAVDADAEEGGFDAELIEDGAAFFGVWVRSGAIFGGEQIDADGEGEDGRQ